MQNANISKKYDAREVESGSYHKWQKLQVFNPDIDKKIRPKKYDKQETKSYTIVIPLPNVTGKLHLGHAWDSTLQDILIRRKRMQGYDTLWLPGMDHAGIATQAKVEADLQKRGISRYDLGRNKFIKKVWQWKDNYAAIIKKQWKGLGLSLDFSRERFTLDKGFSEAVKKVFIDLYKKNLIYRDEYIINWDPQAQTALSDIEVIHKDDKGAFYHIKYFFKDSDFLFNGKNYIEIATTRPETMFGDTAVAVNPSDKRYKKLVNKTVIVPLIGREIKIIEDPYVDKNFGTGIVKITPAHDPNDFKVGNRHNLKRINIMNKNASMNKNAGKYKGLDRFKARKKFVQDLKNKNYIIKINPITHSVGHSERTDAQVEPRLSTQWFVRMKPLAKRALEMQKDPSKRVYFWPKRFETTYKQWMENIHDWVISRQLWWGHQIPAWYKTNKGKKETYVGLKKPKGQDWVQDPDVLDTWFSSGLWPFASLGWPNTQKSDFKRFYPTSTLVSGYDLIFFWISRMIFQAYTFTNKRPFKNVIFHGLIRDSKGRKMSKSLGNGIDPEDVIKKYGADSLRWFLSNGSTLGQDVNFSYDKIKAAWNFLNKIWNISRYILMNIDSHTKNKLPQYNDLKLADKWILFKLNETIKIVNNNFDKFEFNEIGQHIYNFVWDDFADWYIETSKKFLNSENINTKRSTQQVLIYVLDKILKLLHPIVPFITDFIWEKIPKTDNNYDLSLADYPTFEKVFNNPKSGEAFNFLQEIIISVRNIRSQSKVSSSLPLNIYIKPQSSKLQKILKDNLEYVKYFTNPKKINLSNDAKVPKLSVSRFISGANVYIPLSELTNIDKEIKHLEKNLKKFSSEVKRSLNKLGNESFVKKAPKQIIEKEKNKLKDWKNKSKETKKRILEIKNNRG